MHEVVLKPRVAYPFPWPVGKFFDVFPETVQLTRRPSNRCIPIIRGLSTW